MKVILLEDVKSLGKKGEIVKDARNATHELQAQKILRSQNDAEFEDNCRSRPGNDEERCGHPDRGGIPEPARHAFPGLFLG